MDRSSGLCVSPASSTSQLVLQWVFRFTAVHDFCQGQSGKLWALSLFTSRSIGEQFLETCKQCRSTKNKIIRVFLGWTCIMLYTLAPLRCLCIRLSCTGSNLGEGQTKFQAKRVAWVHLRCSHKIKRGTEWGRGSYLCSFWLQAWLNRGGLPCQRCTSPFCL